jgi:thioredoxin-like negative regulator of GroEL
MILKFYRKGCNPCRLLSNKIEALNIKNIIREVDTDTEDGINLSTEFGVSTLPTLIYVRADKEVDRCNGIQGAVDFVKKYGDMDE